MKSSYIFIYSGMIALVFALVFFSFYSAEEPAQLPAVKGFSATSPQLPQQIASVDLNKSYTFAGEALPMSNFDVRERLDREFMVNSYWHSNTMLSIKLAHRYFPLIETILRTNDIPDDFKYLAVAESTLRPVASPAGAKGFWQFMESVGKHYKLEVSEDVDERFHIEKSTQAACELLRDYYNRFGSWTLAAAAYNAGETRMASEIKSQRSNSYFDLNLNEETSRYIFRIVSLKEILSSPESFGFYLREDQLYPPLDDYRVIEVNSPVENWGDFAVGHGTNYRMLKIYNPWLRTGKLNNRSGKTYQVQLPK